MLLYSTYRSIDIDISRSIKLWLAQRRPYLKSILLNAVHTGFVEFTGMLRECSISEAVWNEEISLTKTEFKFLEEIHTRTPADYLENT